MIFHNVEYFDEVESTGGCIVKKLNHILSYSSILMCNNRIICIFFYFYFIIPGIEKSSGNKFENVRSLQVYRPCCTLHVCITAIYHSEFGETVNDLK